MHTRNAYSRMSPIKNQILDVRAGRQQQKVPPFVVADVQTAILVHPAPQKNDKNDVLINLKDMFNVQYICCYLQQRKITKIN